ncbi:hypothetical protein E2C01_079908 [Portunus trituberculatus]|uniref:Uncharacterized protein n=1 Tax=Portunus trituberculatus TaxID=210409 RepID=A0A5B7IU14_PORTR|nr:hypothetical protein [Portunus trituberculatus]
MPCPPLHTPPRPCLPSTPRQRADTWVLCHAQRRRRRRRRKRNGWERISGRKMME